jgi:pimeloyl-ACP methyl ester carboxylesterase
MTPRDPLLPEPQAFYFGDPGRPLLGCLHRPAHGAAEPAMGVLVCAPLGHEDLATHRALRRWAGALAEAGWPVLRFDYPGAGDSADLPAGALWLEAMLQSVHQAADALRQHSGAPRVVLLGVRVGALLAAQVARQRSDVAALVALLPVASGRAWVRECRLLNGQAMNGQALGGAQVHVGAAGGLDLGGLVLDAEQAASLGSVQAGGPPGSLGCAALVIERDDLAGGRYADDLQGSGAEVVVHPLSGLDRVMAVAHSAWLPTRVDALSVDWLQNLALPATPTLSDATSASPLSWSAPAGLLSFSEGARWIDDPVTGVVLTEQLIRIGRAPALAAVLTRAATDAEAAPDARGLLLLSSGAERRCGPNRLWTRFARQRAARGEVVLRLDLAGIGDSAARPGGTEHDVYDPGCQRDIAAALAWLRSALGVGPCAVVGICSGAFHAWRAALSGLPVQAVLPVNPLVFHWLPGMSLDPTAHAFGQLGIASDALRLARDPQRWLKLLRGRVNYRVILSALAGRARAGLRQRARGLARGLGVNLRDDLASELRQVARAGVALHFVFSDQEPGRALLLEQGGAVARRLMDGPQLALHAVAGADHTFTRRADREALYAVLDRALSSVPALAPGPAPASLTASPPASLPASSPASSPASPPAPAPPPAAPPR